MREMDTRYPSSETVFEYFVDPKASLLQQRHQFIVIGSCKLDPNLYVYIFCSCSSVYEDRHRWQAWLADRCMVQCLEPFLIVGWVVLDCIPALDCLHPRFCRHVHGRHGNLSSAQRIDHRLTLRSSRSWYHGNLCGQGLCLVDCNGQCCGIETGCALGKHRGWCKSRNFPATTTNGTHLRRFPLLTPCATSLWPVHLCVSTSMR
jgi:hypothetical protein